MAQYATLKATIDAYIRQNGVKAITGPVLNGVLNAMVESLGSGYLFEGEALPNGDPGTPDQNVVRYATKAGTYTNYGGYVHDGKHLVWLIWNGSWHAHASQVPTDAALVNAITTAIADFYTKAQTDALLAGKQATLQSGVNIKTINNESILGSGNIEIQGGGGTVDVDDHLSLSSENPVQNKVITQKMEDFVEYEEEPGIIPVITDPTNYYTKPQTDTLLGGKQDKATIVTNGAAVQELANNTEYRYTTATPSLTVSAPATVPDDYAAMLVFVSGTTATVFSCPNTWKWSGDNVTSNVFTPAASKTYNVAIWWDGVNINAIARGV